MNSAGLPFICCSFGVIIVPNLADLSWAPFIMCLNRTTNTVDKNKWIKQHNIYIFNSKQLQLPSLLLNDTKISLLQHWICKIWPCRGCRSFRARSEKLRMTEREEVCFPGDTPTRRRFRWTNRDKAVPISTDQHQSCSTWHWSACRLEAEGWQGPGGDCSTNTLLRTVQQHKLIFTSFPRLFSVERTFNVILKVQYYFVFLLLI